MPLPPNMSFYNACCPTCGKDLTDRKTGWIASGHIYLGLFHLRHILYKSCEEHRIGPIFGDSPPNRQIGWVMDWEEKHGVMAEVTYWNDDGSVKERKNVRIM